MLPASGRWPGDDSTLASKSTDRCVNPTTDAFVFVSHLLVSPASTRLSVLNLSLSFLLSPSTGSSSAPFFFSPGHHRSSLTVRTVPDLVRSEERSDPGDRRVVTVIPQKDSDARLLSSTRLSFVPFLFPSLSLPLSFLLRSHRIDTNCQLASKGFRWTGRFSRTN